MCKVNLINMFMASQFSLLILNYRKWIWNFRWILRCIIILVVLVENEILMSNSTSSIVVSITEWCAKLI
jgi:hypothetical protein